MYKREDTVNPKDRGVTQPRLFL